MRSAGCLAAALRLQPLGAARYSGSAAEEGGKQIMRSVRVLAALLAVVGAVAVPASAGSGPTVTGGGSASDMTRFALSVNGGAGHFECLMPSMMTVEAKVTGTTVSGEWATLSGTAAVTLAAHTEFGPPGPMVRGAPYTAIVHAGGSGTGYVDLEILGMSFKGTVEHGQIQIRP
jgi:hypothetical protein